MKKMICIVAAGILCSALSAAQSSQFDVASIKPHLRVAGRPDPQSLRVEPTRLSYTNANLLACIQAAYGIPGEGRPDYRVVGGPDWLTTVRVDIEATTDHAVTKDQLMIMLQSLLADRFKLKAHRESRDLRVYALTVGKNGPKFARAKEDERETLQQARKKDEVDEWQLIVQKNSIARFTEYLSRQLDQPVIDKTGLQGEFSFTLHWIPDVNPPVSVTPPVTRPDVFGPAGIQAIEDQLGLKMENTRSPVDVLVIDHVERTPTEN
jgi:bla regulator protein blaR1